MSKWAVWILNRDDMEMELDYYLLEGTPTVTFDSKKEAEAEIRSLMYQGHEGIMFPVMISDRKNNASSAGNRTRKGRKARAAKR